MFPWYICFSKRLGWSKLRNDIDLPLFAILLGLLIINHSSSERRSIFVLGWLKLSCMGAHFPVFKLDNTIRFSIVFGP